MKHKIALFFHSPSGNCSLYFYGGTFFGKHALTGIDSAKVYTDMQKANAMIDKLKVSYPQARIELY